MPCLFFKASTIKMARVVEKVIVDDRSRVDYDGFLHHSCYHFGALGDVTVILLFFGPPSVDRERGGKGDREGDREWSLSR